MLLMAFVPVVKNPKTKKLPATAKAKVKPENPYYIIVDKSDYELKVYEIEALH